MCFGDSEPPRRRAPKKPVPHGHPNSRLIHSPPPANDPLPCPHHPPQRRHHHHHHHHHHQPSDPPALAAFLEDFSKLCKQAAQPQTTPSVSELESRKALGLSLITNFDTFPEQGQIPGTAKRYIARTSDILCQIRPPHHADLCRLLQQQSEPSKFLVPLDFRMRVAVRILEQRAEYPLTSSPNRPLLVALVPPKRDHFAAVAKASIPLPDSGKHLLATTQARLDRMSSFFTFCEYKDDESSSLKSIVARIESLAKARRRESAKKTGPFTRYEIAAAVAPLVINLAADNKYTTRAAQSLKLPYQRQAMRLADALASYDAVLGGLAACEAYCAALDRAARDFPALLCPRARDALKREAVSATLLWAVEGVFPKLCLVVPEQAGATVRVSDLQK